MNNQLKKILTLATSAALLFSLTIQVAAAGTIAPAGTIAAAGTVADAPTEKEEVIYGILNTDGSTESAYVVNIFSGGQVTDYGSYTQVENLTTADPITQNGDEITVSSSADRLYYQGTLASKKLPWDIAITYTLDGKTVSGEELAGESGALQIHIVVTQNQEVDSFFYENYALQIGLSLKTALCENIVSEGATVAEAGGAKQLSYIVLPGKGADITVSANVHDFVMDAMTFNGIKLALDMNIDYSQFTGQLSQLKDAITKLDGGAGDLLSGVAQLSGGMKQYVSGLEAYKDGLSQLATGAEDLSGGASDLENGLSQLTAQNDALISGARAVQQSTFDAVNAQLSGMGLPTLTPDNYTVVLGGIPSLSAVKTQLDQIVQFTQGVIGYTEGAEQLEAGAGDLADGAGQLSSSLSDVAKASGDLYAAASLLSSGAADLKEGLRQYKDGTAELASGTGDIDGKISDMVDELLEGISGGDQVKSFVSEKNTNVTAVQFVVRTAPVELPESTAGAGSSQSGAASTDTAQAAAPNFWEKLLALFGM